MPIQKLREFLDDNHVPYVTISHSKAYTAQQVAASAHIPGQEMAKTVMLWVDGKMAMAVLPAAYHVDFEELADAIGAGDIALATEREFKDRFPDCEVGGMPPFGNLYGMDVYVAARLTRDEEIWFNAGSHTEVMRLAYRDFERLVEPKIVRFATLIY